MPVQSRRVWKSSNCCRKSIHAFSNKFIFSLGLKTERTAPLCERRWQLQPKGAASGGVFGDLDLDVGVRERFFESLERGLYADRFQLLRQRLARALRR